METSSIPPFSHLLTDTVVNLPSSWQTQPYTWQPEETGLENLIRSNPALELFLNAGPCISWLWQVRSGKYSFMSTNAGTILGYASSSFIKGGVSFTRNLFHPDDTAPVAKLMRKIWVYLMAVPAHERESCQFSCDYRLRKADGSYVRLLEQSRVFQTDTQGNITHIFGVWTDISHWKKNEILTASIQSSENGNCLVCTSVDTQLQPQHTVSKREQEVIKLIAEGLNSQEIADRLGISFHTITTHRNNIREKTNCRKVSELIRYAIHNGMI
ncbi:PAS domain-containing protein [Rhodocytophaga rosea]|uniref:PAS domain-containing protein n=1 Tax=Rhodocytophaga rosea TaxID=2704465 RepID=A0A6C0GDS7_9BACT|nr:LuxR C-terminal-related transcriptional regulator [Rhodocytophaga rosea]QHT66116.1 PAS domain-containing protein [Rhodocytophaga rosea]